MELSACALDRLRVSRLGCRVCRCLSSSKRDLVVVYGGQVTVISEAIRAALGKYKAEGMARCAGRPLAQAPATVLALGGHGTPARPAALQSGCVPGPEPEDGPGVAAAAGSCGEL